MSDWIPWIIGAPILWFALAGIIGFIGVLIEDFPWGGIFRIVMFFVVAYVLYDFFIGY